MSLSAYHQKYAQLADVEIEKRIEAKREELTAIFSAVPFQTSAPEVRVAVLGCGARRFVQGHQRLFADATKKPVMVTTFDITTEHLEGEEGVIEHDCTTPLPAGPYDVTFGHVVLRFLPPESQWDMIRNGYDALAPNGIEIQVMDTEDTDPAKPVPRECFHVDLFEVMRRLDVAAMPYTTVPLRYGQALIVGPKQ